MKQPAWDDYASVFAPVTTRFQAEMYEKSAALLKGSVIDCGCGPCKLAPYLAGSEDVSSYLGVDYSDTMVQLGADTLRKLDRNRFNVRRSRIESTVGVFDCAVSLQSYYSWEQPGLVIRHIFDLLKPGGRFVLASANDRLDIHSLLMQASREWLLYPGWESFAEYNRQLAALPQGNFVSLDQLIGELRNACFSIVDANTRLFQGGLSFVVAEKLSQ